MSDQTNQLSVEHHLITITMHLSKCLTNIQQTDINDTLTMIEHIANFKRKFHNLPINQMLFELTQNRQADDPHSQYWINNYVLLRNNCSRKTIVIDDDDEEVSGTQISSTLETLNNAKETNGESSSEEGNLSCSSPVQVRNTNKKCTKIRKELPKEPYYDAQSEASEDLDKKRKREYAQVKGKNPKYDDTDSESYDEAALTADESLELKRKRVKKSSTTKRKQSREFTGILPAQ